MVLDETDLPESVLKKLAALARGADRRSIISSSVSGETLLNYPVWRAVLTVDCELEKSGPQEPNPGSKSKQARTLIAISPSRGAKCRCDTQSMENANLYTSEQTRVSTKSRIDLQSRERFDGSPSQNLFFDGNHECRRYGTTP